MSFTVENLTEKQIAKAIDHSVNTILDAAYGSMKSGHWETVERPAAVAVA